MMPATETPALDLREKGAPVAGAPQTLDRRLFMQFWAFGGCASVDALAKALGAAGVEGVLYKDQHDPRGVGFVSYAEDPAALSKVGEFLGAQGLEFKPGYSMLGRTYSSGYERDLADWLLEKPKRTVQDPANPWAVWYPLRRKGEFHKLPGEEQGKILREHGAIGRTFGDAGHANDVRLACFGLDPADNDFVIGLIGPELYPLSMCVQAMRRTMQTSTYMEKMGPFFVGQAVWRSGAKAA